MFRVTASAVANAMQSRRLQKHKCVTLTFQKSCFLLLICLTFCSVVPPNSGGTIVEGTQIMLNKALRPVAGKNGLELKSTIVRNKSVTQRILEESKNYGAIMVDATEHRFKKILFGSIPEVIAKESLKTVVLVKKKY